MTGNTKVYQYATTGPYYVEVAGKPRISKRSVQFFRDWLAAAQGQFKNNLAMTKDISAARTFWEEQLTNATAE